MPFLFKLIGALLLLTGIVIGGIVGQRVLVKADLESSLALDEDCQPNCWFNIPSDGSVSRREVHAKLTDLGATPLYLRGSSLRFSLPENGRNIGIIQVTLEEGYAVELCFFPSEPMILGDVVATFGEPDGLWAYQSFNRAQRPPVEDGRFNYDFFDYELIYETPERLITGTLVIYWDDPNPRLPETARVDSICNVVFDQEFNPDRPFHGVRPAELPKWQGFNAPFETYIADPVFFNSTDSSGFSP